MSILGFNVEQLDYTKYIYIENTYNDNNYYYGLFEELNGSTKILTDQFKNNIELVYINISNNIIEIENNAFENCSGLTSLIISNNSVVTIGTNVFLNCTQLKDVSLNIITIPSSLFLNNTPPLFWTQKSKF